MTFEDFCKIEELEEFLKIFKNEFYNIKLHKKDIEMCQEVTFQAFYRDILVRIKIIDYSNADFIKDILTSHKIDSLKQWYIDIACHEYLFELEYSSDSKDKPIVMLRENIGNGYNHNGICNLDEMRFCITKNKTFSFLFFKHFYLFEDMKIW